MTPVVSANSHNRTVESPVLLDGAWNRSRFPLDSPAIQNMEG